MQRVTLNGMHFKTNWEITIIHFSETLLQLTTTG